MSAYIGPDAGVADRVWVGGDSKVTDRAWVGGDSEVTDRAWVGGDSEVTDRAWVRGDSKVTDRARVSGDSEVTDRARVGGDSKVTDRARVGGDSKVTGRARVGGNARISGKGLIERTTDYLTVGPVGSMNRTVTVHRTADGGHLVVAACWQGTLDELRRRIKKNGDHGWPDDKAKHYRDQYRLVIRAAESHMKLHDWSLDREIEE